MTPIKIYGFPRSQHVRKTLAVAHHLEIPVEIVECRPMDQVLKDVNPAARMPAMDDDGFRLGESNAIMLWLCSKKPNGLYPDDPKERAQVNQWLLWEAAHWAPSYGQVQFERMVKPYLNLGAPDEAAVAAGLAKFAREAAYLNAHLEGRQWIVGAAPTLADISVACGLTHAKGMDLPLADYPEILAWNERAQRLEGMKKTAV